MTRAYSYIRFSTPEQAAGDSLRRQTEMAARYCAANKLTLDTETSVKDLGKSGFTPGKQSALIGFMKLVEDGTIEPGSVLLVENLDRLSRQNPRKAASLLGDIVDSGIDVVTLFDGKRYDKSMTGFDYLLVVIQFIRANDESEQKSRRVSAAFAAKRARGEIVSHPPAWLTREREVIPEMAGAVRKIFDMYLSGMGQQAIARALSASKEAGREWGTSYVRRLLGWPAVIGRHTYTLPGGATETREGFFPPIVDVEVFERAQAKLEAGAVGMTRRSQIVQNVLGGLAVCPACGEKMSRINKGSVKGHTGTPKLVCNAAHRRAGCKYVSVDMKLLTDVLIRSADRPFPSKTAGLEEELRSAEAGHDATVAALERCETALLASPKSKSLAAKHAALEAAAERAGAVVKALQTQALQTDTRVLRRRHERLQAALRAEPFEPGAANAVLKECVSKVVVDYVRGALVMHWRHDGTTEIHFA